MCSRNQKKAEEAIKDIIEKSGNNNVHFCLLDLASLKSVRKCAESLMESEGKIDYLVNNAGIFVTDRTLTEDGYEMHFGANHLGHFLLTELLLPLLKKSAASGFQPR